MRLSGRTRRHRRIRKRLFGTSERPRLCVYRSGKHIYGSLVDDQEDRILFTVSTLTKKLKKKIAKEKRVEQAKQVGKLLAEMALKKGIDKVVFDRGGYKYHGRVKALAEGAREGGLKF